MKMPIVFAFFLPVFIICLCMLATAISTPHHKPIKAAVAETRSADTGGETSELIISQPISYRLLIFTR